MRRQIQMMMVATGLAGMLVGMGTAQAGLDWLCTPCLHGCIEVPDAGEVYCRPPPSGGSGGATVQVNVKREPACGNKKGGCSPVELPPDLARLRDECAQWVDAFGDEVIAHGCADVGGEALLLALTEQLVEFDATAFTWCITDEFGTTCYGDAGDIPLDIVMPTDPLASCSKTPGYDTSCFIDCDGGTRCGCKDYLGIFTHCFCYKSGDIDGGENISTWGTICNN